MAKKPNVIAGIVSLKPSASPEIISDLVKLHDDKKIVSGGCRGGKSMAAKGYERTVSEHLARSFQLSTPGLPARYGMLNDRGPVVCGIGPTFTNMANAVWAQKSREDILADINLGKEFLMKESNWLNDNAATAQRLNSEALESQAAEHAEYLKSLGRAPSYGHVVVQIGTPPASCSVAERYGVAYINDQLRALRLDHWKKHGEWRDIQYMFGMDAAVIENARNMAEWHLKAVQTLNSIVTGTAEQDDAAVA